jgi:hypothetical protein
MTYYVGDFNKTTSTLSLKPCKSSSIQVLRAPSDVLFNSSWDESKAREHYTYRTDRMKQINATNELTEMFGSRKAKRAKHTRERGRITQDGISSQTQSTIQERRQDATTNTTTTVDDLASNALMESRKRILPSFNIDATSVQDAYDISSILSDAETRLYLVNVLNAFRKQLSSSSSETTTSKFVFVRKTLARLRATTNVTKRDEALSRLAYVYMLLTLLHCNRRIKSVSRLAENDEFLSSSLLERHVSRFAESSGGEDSYFRSDFHKDKIALHICLLALVLENYQVRPEDLREDLQVPLRKVREYFRELGCVSRSSSVSEGNISTQHQQSKKRKRSELMVLQVPLKFPARRRGRS